MVRNILMGSLGEHRSEPINKRIRGLVAGQAGHATLGERRTQCPGHTTRCAPSRSTGRLGVMPGTRSHRRAHWLLLDLTASAPCYVRRNRRPPKLTDGSLSRNGRWNRGAGHCFRSDRRWPMAIVLVWERSSVPSDPRARNATLPFVSISEAPSPGVARLDK